MATFMAILYYSKPLINKKHCYAKNLILGCHVFFAEEIAYVTSHSKAPPWWGKVIRKGRASGLAPIFVLRQRLAESDKTALGNATIISYGCLSCAADHRNGHKPLCTS
jgi:hypothetical protein